MKIWTSIMLAALISACAGAPEKINYVNDYTNALPGDEQQLDLTPYPDHVAAFANFFNDFSQDTVRERTLDIYAENAYLNDTLKTVRGNAAIRDYFVDMFDALNAMDAKVVEIHGYGNSYFFRWHMRYGIKKLNSGEPIESIGMSHIVFDDTNQVIVHQDYWDSASFFFSTVPVAGKIIEKIRSSESD